MREKRAPTARLEAIKRNVKQTKNMDEFERENMRQVSPFDLQIFKIQFFNYRVSQKKALSES